MVSDEQARAAAREILSRPEFSRWNEDFDAWLRGLEALIELVPDWLIEVLRWLEETVLETVLLGLLRAMGSFLALLGGFGDVPGALGWISVCLLLAAGFVIGHRVRAARRRAAPVDAGPTDPARSHARALEVAGALARQGRFLEAAHRLQLATLGLLIDRDWLELARSDPNRTLRHRVARSALSETDRDELVSLVDRVEALWFDEPREDAELYEAWRAFAERQARRARA